jgi:hypothetical protein
MQTRTVERAPTAGAPPARPRTPARAEAHRAFPLPAMRNQATQRLWIQARLTVNQPGDPYEHEADRVAGEVMRMSGSPQRSRPPHVQRLCPGCEERLSRVAAEETEEEQLLQRNAAAGQSSGLNASDRDDVEGLRGGGRPLPHPARDFFEARFGRDFRGVRIHTGPGATESAQEVRAHAYTVGQHIVFGAGEFAPETTAGRSLLAHELVHTVQQADRGAGRAPRPQAKRDDGHDLSAPRFAGDAMLEAAFDDEALISESSHRRGAHVRRIQESLLAQGYTLPGFRADGIFGPETKAAILQFQRDAGAIRKDGIVGPETMALLDTYDPSKRSGPGPVPRPGPVPGPRPAPAAGCDRPFAGVSFSLTAQVKDSVSPGAEIRILQDTKDRPYLRMRGHPLAVWYRPEVTIAAPDDATAQQFEIGFIQNILSCFRVAHYGGGAVVFTALPALPLKDGFPLSSSRYDPVFIDSSRLQTFSDRDAPTDNLRFGDAPSSAAYLNLRDNPSCAGAGSAATMFGMTMHDEFRTWLAVRHRPTGCVKPLHHIDWNLLWDATVTHLGTVPVLGINNNVIQVTVPKGNGRPPFIQGGPVANDAAQKTCRP